MKKIIKPTLIVLLLLILVFLSFIYMYAPFSPNRGWPSNLPDDYLDTGIYKITPNTIVEDIDKGNTDVFLPDSRTLSDRVSGPPLYNNPVTWGQFDYLKIAYALNQFVWHDEFEDWKLLRMIFNSPCQNDFSGLTGSDFLYFKPISHAGKLSYLWREIEIDPDYSYVAWGISARYAPPLLGLRSIDLNNLYIKAEDAIKIAEENGGKSARLRVQNQCNIHLLLLLERFTGWVIEYQSADFEILIDPYTGEVIK